MTRNLLLATAMVLTPVYAMASSSIPEKPRTQALGLNGVITPACTPYNPCAVPTPAISASTSPLIAELERQARTAPSPRRQTR